MQFIRYANGDQTGWGRVEGDQVHELSAAPWAGGQETGNTLALSGLRLLAPAEPRKIVCVGRNYVAHAQELGHDVPTEPLIFFKPPTSLIGPDDEIRYPALTSELHYEGELTVVIGERARHLSEENALDYVFGYTCANDVTARDLQNKDGQWARAKGFDTFCPVGPVIVTGLDPQAQHLRTLVNGEVRQDAMTDLQIFPLTRLLAFITAAMTLEPGDLVLTGTPAGVGTLQVGDEVVVEIDGIGALRNTVVADE